MTERSEYGSGRSRLLSARTVHHYETLAADAMGRRGEEPAVDPSWKLFGYNDPAELVPAPELELELVEELHHAWEWREILASSGPGR
jgi:hypothetical protein